MSTMTEARERATVAWTAYTKALDEANAAEAECQRMEMLAFAERFPGITSFVISSEYSYDDEGGYFESFDVSVDDSEVDEAVIAEHGDPNETLMDDIQLTAGVVELLLESTNHEGSVTVERLRELSF